MENKTQPDYQPNTEHTRAIPWYHLEVSEELNISKPEVDRLNIILHFIASSPPLLLNIQKDALAGFPEITEETEETIMVKQSVLDRFKKQYEAFNIVDGDLNDDDTLSDEKNREMKAGVDNLFADAQITTEEQSIAIQVRDVSQYTFLKEQVFLAKHDISSSLRTAATYEQLYEMGYSSKDMKSVRMSLNNIPRDIAAAQEILDPEFSAMVVLPVGHVVDMFRSYPNPTNLTVKFPDSSLPPEFTVKTSPKLLERLWKNVIVNAQEAYMDRKITGEQTLTVRVDQTERTVVFEDRAGGFEQTFIDKGFSRGKRGEKGTVGTGVAMRTLNDLLRFQGIRLDVDNTKDEPKGGMTILRFPEVENTGEKK